MAADWLEKVGHGSGFVRASGSVVVADWLEQVVMAADWLEQVGHGGNWLEQVGYGSRLVRVSGSW